MAVFYDQLNREVNLPSTPKRIISIVPSQTELLFYWGLDEEVIGITKFCIHPVDKFKTTTKVGGTKQLNIELIRELKPDLIIANKEENEKAQVEELMTICPVWISDISNLDEALDMINRVGELIGHSKEAHVLTTEIYRLFSQLIIKPLNIKVTYLIWRKPYMAAGRQTFIDDLLQRCGFINAFNRERYPEITDEMLVDAKPAVVFLSSEPYPFTPKHVDEFNALLPNAQVLLVDGELFSWYGSRLLHAPDYFRGLIDKIIR